MFGTLRPRLVVLDAPTRGAWQRLYCGTCQSLGEQFGHVQRGLLSHDAVFLAALVDGLQAQPAAPSRTRCPMLPIVHRATLAPSSVAMRYAASVQLLLADQWVADRASERPRLAALARPLLRGSAEHARSELAALGSGLGELEHFELRQAAVEQRRGVGPAEAAEPTASALALVFERIAALPGSVLVDDAMREHARALLARLGRALGTLIYLVDALEDLERDLGERAFNPCTRRDLLGRTHVEPARVREAEQLLAAALRELELVLPELPLARHRALLVNVLHVELAGRARRARAAAQRVVAHGPRSTWTRVRDVLLEFWRRRPVHQLGQALAASVMVLWTVASATIAKAAPPKKVPKKKVEQPEPAETSESESDSETGSETGTSSGEDTGSSSDSSSTTSGDTPSETGDTPEPPAPELPDDEPGGSICFCTEWFRQLTFECCDGVCGNADACGSACGACGGCASQGGDCCSGCGGALGNCGQCNACNDCGNCGACNDCGKCGNGCNDCGKCGNGCGDCGKCGNDCGNCGNCGGGGCGGGGGGCNC